MFRQLSLKSARLEAVVRPSAPTYQPPHLRDRSGPRLGLSKTPKADDAACARPIVRVTET
jgi:hypothetical protein